MSVESAKTKRSGKVSKTKAPKSAKKTDASKNVVDQTIDSTAIIKKLADNSRQVRETALKTVARYVGSSKTLEPFQLQKLWVGMFYTMWHSDRPLTQQALARDLASLVGSVKDKNLWTFINAFWTIMIREWESLDSHRINKFYMLVRLVVGAIFKRLAENGWTEEDLTTLRVSLLEGGPLDPTSLHHPHSLRLHVIDIYLDELEKVFEEKKERPEGPTVLLIVAPVLVQLEISDFKLVKKRVQDDFITDSRLFEWEALEKPEEEAADEDDEDAGDWEGFD